MRAIALILAGLFQLLVVLGLGGWLYLRAPDIPAAALETKYARANSHYADLGDGLRVHYLESGPASAPTLLLIHGFGDNSFSWDGWTKVLAKDHHVLAIDLPGHGLTQTPPGTTVAPDRLADVVGRFLATKQLSHVAVAGNSLGGAVAWQLALRHPDAVGALVLVDAAGWPNQTLQKPPLAFRLMKYKIGRDFIASIDNTPLIREGLKKDVVNQSVLTESFIQRWADLQRLPGHRPILMSIDPGAIAATDAILAPIHVPTLILWGADDQLIDVASAHKFAAAIKGSQLIIYPHVGHLAMVDAPERTASDVATFLARHRG